MIGFAQWMSAKPLRRASPMSTLSTCSAAVKPSEEAPVSRSWPAAVLAGVAIASVLLWFAGYGLRAYFTGDDLMNAYLAWRQPYYQILLENIFYFSPQYRPMGSLVYRLLYDAAGLDALPFRLFCYALLLGNLYLLYRAAAAIGGREAGLLTALLASYNSAFAEIYSNSGTLYDLLCFAFYLPALELYVKTRKRGQSLKGRRLAGFLALYICALNSKEMAVTLPAVLFVYEFLFSGMGAAQIRANFHTRWTPLLLTAAATAPFAIGKLQRSSPFTGNEGYRLHFGWHTYARALAHYLEIFFLPPDSLRPGPFLGIVLLLGTLALLARRRSMLFAWLFIVITPAPVVFIPLRGGYAVYIPAFGMALFMAVMIVEIRKTLAELILESGAILTAQARRIMQFDTFVWTLLVLLAFHNSRPVPEVYAEDRAIRSLATQVAAMPKIDPKARVLFTDDPFPKDDWALLFFFRLYYRAPEMVVDRIKRMPQKPDRNERSTYDYILSFDGTRLTRAH